MHGPAIDPELSTPHAPAHSAAAHSAITHHELQPLANAPAAMVQQGTRHVFKQPGAAGMLALLLSLAR